MQASTFGFQVTKALHYDNRFVLPKSLTSGARNHKMAALVQLYVNEREY
jgi:hypothetical protein